MCWVFGAFRPRRRPSRPARLLQQRASGGVYSTGGRQDRGHAGYHKRTWSLRFPASYGGETLDRPRRDAILLVQAVSVPLHDRWRGHAPTTSRTVVDLRRCRPRSLLGARRHRGYAAAGSSFHVSRRLAAPRHAVGRARPAGQLADHDLLATRLRAIRSTASAASLNDENGRAEAVPAASRRATKRKFKPTRWEWATGPRRRPAPKRRGSTSLISYPLDGQLPALTAARRGARRTEFRSDDRAGLRLAGDFDAWDRSSRAACRRRCCRSTTTTAFEIHQSPGYVVINLEMIHEARVETLDGRHALDPAIKQWMGESRGHWEGATLVAETTNFTGKAGMLISGIPGGVRGPRPSSLGMKTTERFTRVGDDRIDYEMTIEDREASKPINGPSATRCSSTPATSSTSTPAMKTTRPCATSSRRRATSAA